MSRRQEEESDKASMCESGHWVKFFTDSVEKTRSNPYFLLPPSQNDQSLLIKIGMFQFSQFSSEIRPQSGYQVKSMRLRYRKKTWINHFYAMYWPIHAIVSCNTLLSSWVLKVTYESNQWCRRCQKTLLERFHSGYIVIHGRLKIWKFDISTFRLPSKRGFKTLSPRLNQTHENIYNSVEQNFFFSSWCYFFPSFWTVTYPHNIYIER